MPAVHVNVTAPHRHQRHRPRAAVTVRTLATGSVLVSVEGELDAHNAGELTDTARRATETAASLVIDLSRTSFVGTELFHALSAIDRSAAGHHTSWVLIPGTAASRVLRLCAGHRAGD
ncbi:STAS domain-containing protein [Mycolicibacterium palauense]|uniref:STAS domain-containing protein n=1 Tax=Mycolicibacterium palauense TaxID=2034511 RepID=UPI000BFF12D3|nr:STAS domain-containing protein [Mycolicibacterium palauense]